jgi:hypothetical protein
MCIGEVCGIAAHGSQGNADRIARGNVRAVGKAEVLESLTPQADCRKLSLRVVIEGSD